MVDISIEYDKEEYSPRDSVGSSFAISLVNDIFFQFQVSAQISINVRNSSKSICSAFLTVKGYSLVKWETYESMIIIEIILHYCISDKQTKKYGTIHTYFSESKFLLFTPPEENPIILPVGVHKYDYK